MVGKFQGNFVAWNVRGNSLASKGRYKEAVAAFDKALEISPRFFEAWYNKASAFEGLGKKHKADECYYIAFILELLSYNKVLERNPMDADAWNGRGIVLELLGDSRRALESFNKALKIDSENDEIWFNKAYALKNLGKHQEAMECYDQIGD